MSEMREVGESSVLADLVSLTKPRVISLLLVTPIASMFATGRGLPPWWLVVVVAFAGYLMAGGANAINMWCRLSLPEEQHSGSIRRGESHVD